MVAAGTLLWFTPFVAAQTGLRVVRPELHQFDDGPPLPGNHGFVGGETVFLTFRIAGFQKPENRRIDLAYRVRVVDPDGVPLVPSHQAAIAAQIFDEDKNWMPKGRHEFVLPPWTKPGQSKILIEVEDKLAKATATAETTFRVRGREVEYSDTLVARNFTFLRDENDRQGLTVAAYRPGDLIWARMDLTGYRLGPKNELDVGYGITVLKPGGETFFSQPEAAREQGEPVFYPRRVLPAVLNLTTSKNVAPGRYTLVVLVRDYLGGQEFEVRQAFTIE